jgi:hypothetical protein
VAPASQGRVRAAESESTAAADPRLADVTIVPTVPAATRAEAKIFVAPHAPDDPGPEDPAASDDDVYPPRAYRTVKR